MMTLFFIENFQRSPLVGLWLTQAMQGSTLRCHGNHFDGITAGAMYTM